MLNGVELVDALFWFTSVGGGVILSAIAFIFLEVLRVPFLCVVPLRCVCLWFCVQCVYASFCIH